MVAALSLLAAASLPHAASAETATLVGDAYTKSTSPNSHFATTTTLAVQGPPATGTQARAFLQFDLSTLPAGTIGAYVGKATLTLGVRTVPIAGAFDVFRVTSPWGEATLTNNVAPTLGGAPEVSGVALAPADKNTFKAVDVTALVKDWLDNVLPNDGIALVPNGAGLSATFDSKESTSTSHFAQLDIVLSNAATFSGSLSGDVTGVQTATHVGKINGSTLGSLAGATSGQALTFSGSNWSPSSVVNSLSAGSGLSVSGATGNVSMSVPAAGVTNSMLANSSLTVSAGTGLSGGGAVALGGSTTLNNAGVLSVGASAPLASSGGQSPSVSLTGTVPLANGGTGASTASGARGNLGAAASGANSDITSLSGITGNISLPISTSSSVGVIRKSGIPFVHDFQGTYLGLGAGNFTSTGGSNIGVGYAALSGVTTGYGNTAVGAFSLWNNTDGVGNTAVGSPTAMNVNTTGSANVAIGQALNSNTTGNDNIAVGSGALNLNTTGGNNIAMGFFAGENLTTGNNNIDIANTGVAAESNTIRIGTVGTQTTTFIAGISGATSSSGIAVFVNASGQLGTATSSARFKDDIQDMGDSTSALMRLRPVRFRYKQDIDPSGLEQYGLVAEEVAKVYPALVVYDDNHQPQTVRYHFVNAMLLNEVQKQARQLHEQTGQIAALTARLEQLESALVTHGPTGAVSISYK